MASKTYEEPLTLQNKKANNPILKRARDLEGDLTEEDTQAHALARSLTHVCGLVTQKPAPRPASSGGRAGWNSSETALCPR